MPLLSHSVATSSSSSHLRTFFQLSIICVKSLKPMACKWVGSKIVGVSIQCLLTNSAAVIRVVKYDREILVLLNCCSSVHSCKKLVITFGRKLQILHCWCIGDWTQTPFSGYIARSAILKLKPGPVTSIFGFCWLVWIELRSFNLCLEPSTQNSLVDVNIGSTRNSLASSNRMKNTNRWPLDFLSKFMVQTSMSYIMYLIHDVCRTDSIVNRV